jgi:regulator of sigma E protease
VFGLVIFVHELGHFLAAKAAGVYAPRFSIGFGPALWRRRFGETEYVLAALPLGGYVRMASRLDEDMATLEGGSEQRTSKGEGDRDFDPNAMIPFGPLPIPEHRLFESKSLLARIVILIAGVSMNALLAFVLAIGLQMYFGPVIVDTRVVGDVESIATAPALTQLHAGDTIQSVNGKSVASWNDVVRNIVTSVNVVSIRTQRGDVQVPVGGSTKTSPEDVAGAINFYVPPIIDSVVRGDRAQVAGLRAGDSVVAIAGQTVRTWSDLVRIVSASANRPLLFTVTQGGHTRSVEVTPKEVEGPDETGATTKAGRIGAAARQPIRRQPLGFGEAIGSGARVTWLMAGSIVTIVKRLFVGEISVRQLSGPVGITRMSVAAARSGLEDLLGLIALLSINVAVLNLLPIPILDGGQIVINVLESVKGRPFSLRTREYILRFGLLAIALLFVVVMYNDTRGWIGKLVGWVAKLFG